MACGQRIGTNKKIWQNRQRHRCPQVTTVSDVIGTRYSRTVTGYYLVLRSFPLGTILAISERQSLHGGNDPRNEKKTFPGIVKFSFTIVSHLSRLVGEDKSCYY